MRLRIQIQCTSQKSAVAHCNAMTADDCTSESASSGEPDSKRRALDGVLLTIPPAVADVRGLQNYIRGRFDLPENPVLNVDGFVLPSSQELAVLRDNDTVGVRGLPHARATTKAALPCPDAVERGDDGRGAFIRDWPSSELLATSADYYFNAYRHYGVHEDVLRDSATSTAFVNAVEGSSHLLRGKVVLDVCAGLGFCSLLAARAGAKRVIAIEAEPELVSMAEKVVRQNGFGPDVIEFVCAHVHSLEQLPDGISEVDALISQWLGFGLLHESRLPDVLCARDRWLREGGCILPDRASLHVALLQDDSLKDRHLEYGDVWGFNFSSMRAHVRKQPVVCAYQRRDLLSTSQCLFDIDLRTCDADLGALAAKFDLDVTRRGKAQGVLLWFQVSFNTCVEPVVFATGPQSPETCWKQTALMFDGMPEPVKLHDQVQAMIAVRKPCADRRNLDIKLSWCVNSGARRTQLFHWH